MKALIVMDMNMKMDWFGLAGLNSKNSNSTGNDLSSTNSKVSAGSVPQTPRSEGEILKSSNVKSYTLAELKSATRNFRPDSVLGEGGFGSVFKGWIDENSLAPAKPGTGIVIAVKRLNQESFQGHREWLVSLIYLFKPFAFDNYKKQIVSVTLFDQLPRYYG
jgi:hypothetical protein